MELALKIKTPDKKIIYGTLRGSLDNPLIIFVHGFTGNMNEHIFFNGARFFAKQGYSTFRFNLYSWEKGARVMEECDSQVHANDLDTVVKFFRLKKVKKIIVIGHSFGGPSVLKSRNQDFEIVVLWDPSYNPSDIAEETEYIKEIDAYTEQWGYRIIIGKRMIEDFKSIDSDKLVKDLNKPIKFIMAEKGILVKRGRKYLKAANEPKDFVVVKNADHNFNNEGTEMQLFEQTLNWIKQF